MSRQTNNPSSRHTTEAPDQRLRRLSGWCLHSSATAAELELTEWQHDPDCPDEALLLLAALHARMGQAHDAASVLKRIDPTHVVADDALRLLAAVMVTQGWTEAARQATQTLFHEHGFSAPVKRWIELMRLPGSESLSATPTATTEHLAVELLHDLTVIPSLVGGLRCAPEAGQVRLLRDAIQCIERDVSQPRDQLTIYAAAGELALLDNAPDDARRWAKRGLAVDPYNATLALLLNRAAEALEQPARDTDSQEALESLRTAAQRHPGYPDVRAALIRREFVSGDRDAAQQRLLDWLKQQPDHPIATELHREQAA